MMRGAVVKGNEFDFQTPTTKFMQMQKTLGLPA
jgi:hypothetical protein